MKRVEEIDFARVLAMFGVILIHVTSTYVYYESKVSAFGINLAFFINQLTRYAVPLFVILSGVSTQLSYKGESIGTFYKKRLMKIGVPYLIWFVLYFLYNTMIYKTEANVLTFVKQLILGQSAPHLYFIIIVLQFYLLYPLLRRFVDKSPWVSVLVSFVITFAVEKLTSFQSYGVNLIPLFLRPYLWRLFPTWIFYFVFGMAVAKCAIPRFRDFAGKNSIAIVAVTIVFIFLYVLESRTTGVLDSVKTALNVYAPLSLLCAFSLWEYLGRFSVVKKLTMFYSKHSMTIYFEHIFFIYVLSRFSIFARGMLGMALLFIAVTALATAAAVVIDGAKVRIKTLRS